MSNAKADEGAKLRLRAKRLIGRVSVKNGTQATFSRAAFRRTTCATEPATALASSFGGCAFNYAIDEQQNDGAYD